MNMQQIRSEYITLKQMKYEYVTDQILKCNK